METQRPLEAMSCDELLKELARISSERDHLSAQVASPVQSNTEQASQVEDLLDENHRLNRISELLKAKGCQQEG